MAVYNSSQSGPFDVASTWGGAGVPADGDSFNVSQGHIVAVTGDNRVATGYNDSNVYGKLHIENSGMLRMNGMLFVDCLTDSYFTEGVNSGAFFRMDPGSKLEIRGTDADAHRLYFRGDSRLTAEIIGTNPNPQTTIAADISPSGSPGPISFTDASDFRIGDWINVHMPERTGKSWIYYRSDEAFWIHDIDNNNVYYKQFVGPEATITAVSSNKIVVNDAKVFRKGYHIIFGTGSNRNVKTITSIGYGSNTITLDSNVTGSVVGEKVYQTGCEKPHISGDLVLRIAAVTTTNAAVGDNTITVNNTNGFSVGDMILIQPNSDNYSEVSYGNFIADYTITDINTSTNVITFTNGFVSTGQTTLQKVTNAGALVVNMTRDTKITAPEGTTFGANERSSVYFQYVGNYLRRVKIKNVEFRLGAHSDYNNYSIIGMRGQMSHELTSNGQYVSEFDGNVIYPVYTYYRNTGYMWERLYLNHRNNISYNAGTDGFFSYGDHMGWFSNIAMCCGSWGYNYGQSYNGETICYNYSACCVNGFYTPQWGWTGSKSFSHNIVLNTSTSFGSDYIYCTGYAFRLYVDRYVYGPFFTASRRSKIYLLDSYLGNVWDVTNPNGNGTAYSIYYQGALDGNQTVNSAADDSNTVYSICDNFKYDGMREAKRDALRIWDANEKAWKTYPDYDYNATSYYCGFGNTFFLPAGAKAFVTGEAKLVNSAGTNYPYLWVGKVGDLYYMGRYISYDGINDGTVTIDSPLVNKHIGFARLDTFTSACKTDFVTKTITVGPFVDDMFIKAAVVSLSNTAGYLNYGWYEKDMKIVIDTPYPMVAEVEALSTLSTRLPIRYGASAEQTNTIWGG